MSMTSASRQCVGNSPDLAQSPCRQTFVASLCEECASIDTLNAKISAAEKSLLEMKEARQKVLTKANRKHDVLMNRFPLEISSEIFRHYLPSVEQVNQQQSTPLILSAVSRSWRALCHSMPDLWAVMSLRATSRNDYRSKTCAEVAQEWIRRSKQLPLTAVIDIAAQVDPEGAHFPAIIGAINQQSQRLTYLWMRTPPNLVDLVNFQDYGAPKLLHLSVQALGPILHGPRFVSCAPVMLRISINNPWNLFKRYGIVSDNLTEAHLIGIQWQDLMEIFHNSKQLRSCSIHKDLRGLPPWEPWSNNQFKPLAIVHDTLQSFHLIEQHYTFIFTILMELLILPSLTELRLISNGMVSGANTRDLFSQLQAHIGRSSSKLSVLALCNFNFDNFGEGQLYTPMSDLIRAVAPTIQHITIEPSADTEFHDPARLIRSIVDCGAPLPLLEFLQVYGPPKWWMHTLRELTTAGEVFYGTTGRTVRLSLNVRKCSAWWSNTLNELIGLPRTHPEDYDEDEHHTLTHGDLPILSIEDINSFVSSMLTQPPGFFVQVSTAEKGDLMDASPQVIKTLLEYIERSQSQGVAQG